MKPTGVAFHHPVAFWAGCALIVAGVLAHGPMFLMGEHTHWRCRPTARRSIANT